VKGEDLGVEWVYKREWVGVGEGAGGGWSDE